MIIHDNSTLCLLRRRRGITRLLQQWILICQQIPFLLRRYKVELSWTIVNILKNVFHPLTTRVLWEPTECFNNERQEFDRSSPYYISILTLGFNKVVHFLTEANYIIAIVFISLTYLSLITFPNSSQITTAIAMGILDGKTKDHPPPALALHHRRIHAR